MDAGVGPSRPIFPRARGRGVPAPSRAGSCPVCGRHDAVRQVHAMYQDRRRHLPEPPLVTRYGLMMRGAALLVAMPRAPARVPPPRRPSIVAAYVGLSGVQVPLAMLAVLLGVALVVHAGMVVVFGSSLGVAFLAGLLGEPLRRRGDARWARRTAEWHAAMRAWRNLRYCSRCDHVFGRESRAGGSH